MSRSVRCPYCRVDVICVPTSGQDFSCPACGNHFRVAASAPSKSAPPPPRQSMPASVTRPITTPPARGPANAAAQTGADQVTVKFSRQHLLIGSAVAGFVVLLFVAIFSFSLGNQASRPIAKRPTSSQTSNSELAVPSPSVDVSQTPNSPLGNSESNLPSSATSPSPITPTSLDSATDQPQVPVAESNAHQDVQDLFEDVAPAVVLIEVVDVAGERVALGSGFFINENGLLVTNAHVVVVPGASSVVVRLADDSQHVVDEISAIDLHMDLAVLRIRAGRVTSLPLRPDVPRVGTRVYAIGNPIGLRHTLSEGLVSGLRPIDGTHAIIQTSAAISSGSSGGPLIDGEGQVLGVNTLQFVDGQNLNFAVPASAVKELLARNQSPQNIAALAARKGSETSPASVARTPLMIPVSDRQSLTGLAGIAVLIEELHPEATLAGLSRSSLQATVERRLRQRGVKVLSENERVAEQRGAYLYVNVATIASPDLATYGYAIRVELKQSVRLIDNSDEVDLVTNATTWSAPGIFGSVGRLRFASTVGTSVNELVDRFSTDF